MCHLCALFNPTSSGSAAGASPSALGDHFWSGIPAGQEGADAAENTATAYSMQVGQSFYGTISSSTDEDWVAINLVAGQTYDIRLLGEGLTFLTDPFLAIRNSAGTIVASDDDSFSSGSNTHETDSRLIFTATATGTYYIEADAFSTQTGDYLLTATANNPNGMVFTADEIAWQLTNNGEAFFSATEAAAFNVGGDNSLTVNITLLTTQGQYLARQALLAWTNVTGIVFVETAGAAEITFDDSDAGTTAYANTNISGGVILSSTVMITTGWLSNFGTSLASYSFETYIHEIGHALGLAHGGNYNGSASYGTDNYYLNDSLAWSIMSYMQAENDEFASGGDWNTFVDAAFRYLVTPQIADIIAIQNLYGDHTGAFTGNTTYGFNANTGNTALDTIVAQGPLAAFTIYDSAGTDTMDFSGYGGSQIISLLAESMSSVLGGRHNVAIARGVVIEKAIGGSGSDTMIGNSGTNTLDGRGGADDMFGGQGSDIYYVDTAGDRVFESTGQGTDTVYARVSYALAAAQSVEVLSASQQAATTAINLTGNELGQTVRGNAGNNVLDGRGGIDQMFGFAGNDTYYVDRAADGVYEVAGQGSDTVYARVSYALGAGQSIELLATYKASGAEAIHLTGNELAQTVRGNAGNNLVNGGRGNDTLTGNGGFDTFVFDTTLSSSNNVDTITDFSVPQDSIRLENSIFTALTTTGTLSAAAFRIGSAAADSSDRIIYNSGNGRLYYDADGNGAGGMSHFATLSTGLAMTNLDFVVV